VTVAIGSQGFLQFIEDRLGRGTITLLRYGPGSGGELLLKELVDATPQGSIGIMFSTYESEDDLRCGHHMLLRKDNVVVISLMDLQGSEAERVIKRDRFIIDGVMVTDLLEISMANKATRGPRPLQEALARMTSEVSKQVLPFHFALDSLHELIEGAGTGPVRSRLHLIRRAVAANDGIAIMGCPVGPDPMCGLEMNTFDNIIELEAVRNGTNWDRRLVLLHKRNGLRPPQEWSVVFRDDVPAANPLE